MKAASTWPFPNSAPPNRGQNVGASKTPSALQPKKSNELRVLRATHRNRNRLTPEEMRQMEDALL